MSRYETVENGVINTSDYRLYFKDKKTNEFVSPFHDIPLYHDKENGILNAIIETPRWTNAKLEISKKEKLNPIMHDVKNNKLRFVANIFPYHGYICNYGLLPQTWEDPFSIDKFTGCKGDNDPIDFCEIGTKVKKTGSVIQIKILGIFGLIDNNENDWKIIGIDIKDPLSTVLNCLNDIQTYFPGLLESTLDWFRVYKIPDGKAENKFALNGKYLESNFAFKVIDHYHEAWKSLLQGNFKSKSDVSIWNTTLNGEFRLQTSECYKIVYEKKETKKNEKYEIDKSQLDRVYYIKRKFH